MPSLQRCVSVNINVTIFFIIETWIRYKYIYLWNAYPSSDFTFGCHTTIQPPKWRITGANTYSSYSPILSLHFPLLLWDIPRVLCVGYLIHLYSLCSLTVTIVFDFLKSSGILYFLLYIRLIYPNWRNLTCFTWVYFDTCRYENGWI